MTVNSVSGFGISSIFRNIKPCFVWDPMHPQIGSGIAKDGTSNVGFTIVTNDSVATDHVGAWVSSNDRFEYTTENTDITKVFGSVGDFTEGYTHNYMSNDWSDTTLGFAVVSPTGSGQLSQLGDSTPDIIYGRTHGNTTYVDTDGESQAVIIEQSASRSATYNRVFQVLVKSVDGNNPSTVGAQLGINTSSGTRTTSSDTVWRALPGSRGWYCGYLSIGSGGSPVYLGMSFPVDTGRWYIAAPMFYSAWSSMEYILRAPVDDGQRRGDYIITSANSDFSIPTAGWLAMSIIMPERSVSNGHLDISGAGDFGYGELFNWVSGDWRIRVMMSDTYDNLVIQQDEDSSSFCYNQFGDDWVDWEAIGFVLTWGKRSGATHSFLYVNGKKIDSEYDTENWYPSGLTASNLSIGSDGESLGLADTWIPRCAVGRKPLHRVTARALSLKMRDYAVARGGVLGDMS